MRSSTRRPVAAALAISTGALPALVAFGDEYPVVSHAKVPEVKLGRQWCMLDASIINYFQKPDGSIAGVEEISKSIGEWYAAHLELRGNNDKLHKFMLADGWKAGPSVVAGNHWYDDNGWLPAATHAWSSTMVEFGGASKDFVYEYVSAIGSCWSRNSGPANCPFTTRAIADEARATSTQPR